MIRKLFKKSSNKNQALRNIEKKLGISFDKIPEYIPIRNDALKMIERFKTKYGWEGDLNLKISKNDLMFLTSIWSVKYDEAFMAYLQTGLNARNIITKLAAHKYGSTDNVESMLDFASGYGRVTRFLVNDFNPEKIWVSDIKENGVQFQKEVFGVNGVNSSYVPEEFQPGRKFQVIFVGSLFSHLPDDLFNRWLSQLHSLLNENGLLIFSVLDLERHGSPDAEYFEYKMVSEDQAFSDVNDSIKEISNYGMAYVSKKYMDDSLTKIEVQKDQFYVYKNSFGTIQDVYAVSKDSNTFNDSLDLSSYP